MAALAPFKRGSTCYCNCHAIVRATSAITEVCGQAAAVTPSDAQMTVGACGGDGWRAVEDSLGVVGQAETGCTRRGL